MRVRIAQYVWLGLALAAALLADATGAPRWTLAAGLALAVAPATAEGLVDRFQWGRAPAAQAVLAIVWSCAAMAAFAATGGAGSPLAIAFFLGPLTALGAGRRRLALEIAIFSGAAYLIAYMLAAFSPGLAETAAAVAPAARAWAFAVAVQVVVLVWAVQEAPAQATAGEADEAAPAPTAAPAEAPWALLSATPHGRLRSVEGAADMVSPRARSGALLEDALGLDPGAPELAELLAQRGAVALPAIGEGPDRLALAVASASGPHVLILPKPGGHVQSGAGDTDAALAERTAYFASLGHELKTPLNAVMGFADLMRAEVRGPVPDAYKDYAQLIHESGQDLMLLVDDILDLAKAEADRHRLEFEPVDLAASGASVMRQLQDQADRRGVALELAVDGDEVWAEADPRAVRQIWQNLVSNGVKYAKEEGGLVTLSARADRGAAVLSVRDNGEGMDPAASATILEPFRQGENAGRTAGTGLGLAVVKAFADLHGGKLTIETAPGRGLLAEVTLPLADVSDLPSLEDAAE